MEDLSKRGEENQKPGGISDGGTYGQDLIGGAARAATLWPQKHSHSRVFAAPL